MTFKHREQGAVGMREVIAGLIPVSYAICLQASSLTFRAAPDARPLLISSNIF